MNVIIAIAVGAAALLLIMIILLKSASLADTTAKRTLWENTLAGHRNVTMKVKAGLMLYIAAMAATKTLDSAIQKKKIQVFAEMVLAKIKRKGVARRIVCRYILQGLMLSTAGTIGV